MASNPAGAANSGKAVFGMVGYQPSFTRPPGDHGEFIKRMDLEFRERWLALTAWKEDPSALSSLPAIDEWAAHVDYIIKLVGADHVAIGLQAIVQFLNKEISTVLALPEVKEQFGKIAVEPVGESIAETTKFFAAERDKWGSVIKSANISVE
jgi:microsomal dipeptidase-like Zn-dependent dipeptidase